MRRFDPVRTTTKTGAIFFKGPKTGFILNNATVQSESRQLINNTYNVFSDSVIQDCLFQGTRWWKNYRLAVWTKWYLRLYDVEAMLIEHNHFRRRLIEHDVYLSVTGDVTIVGNYFQDAFAQAVQTVFRGEPHHGVLETSIPGAVTRSAKIRLINNLVVNCGHTGFHWARGSGQPFAFAFSQHKCLDGMEVYYHGNHLIQKGTGPFNYSAGTGANGARSGGAIMAEHKAYTEGIGNIIDYRQPSDRPVLQLDSNRADYWEGNTFVQGGKVKFINPHDVVWRNNKGPGVVMLGKQVLGPVTGTYIFSNGERVE